MTTQTAPRPRTQAQLDRDAQVSITAQAKNAALVEEIDFLLHCAVGEAAIVHALGYVGRTAALKRRLARMNRYDLVPRIFEADALYKDRHASMGIPAAHRARKKAAA
jgi:hypothetical protein